MHTTRRRLLEAFAATGTLLTGASVVSASTNDRFIVDTRGLAGDALDRAGLDVVHDVGEVDLAVVRGAESDLEAVTGDYAPDTEATFELPVEGVSADAVDPAEAVPEDESATDEPFFPFQWDKRAQDVQAAHEETRGEGARVAVIDTGVGAEHPDLQHAVNAGLSRDFTGDGFGAPGPWGGDHGTHVAGIVAANDRNEEGVVGTAPGAEIVDCRVFSLGGSASFGDILAALAYAASIECDVANMSLGAYPVAREGLGSFYGRMLNRTTTFANRQGTLLVVAAGNDAADLQHDGGVISLPNEAAQAVSVSATGPVGFGFDPTTVGDEPEPAESPAFYTNFGTNAIDVAAPGGDASLAAQAADGDGDGMDPDWVLDLVFNTVAVPDPENLGDTDAVNYAYNWIAGTSMAAPQVAGAAALVKSANGDLNANQVESVLERTASVPDEFGKEFYGSGFLDTAGAVERAAEMAADGNGNGRGRGNGD